MSIELEAIYIGVSVASAACSGVAFLLSLFIFFDKSQRNADVDYFIPTSLYINFCNLIWCILSAILGFFSATNRSNVQNIECVVQSTASMTLIKMSALWTVALLYQMFRFIRRPEPFGIIPQFNDGYFNEVEKSKGKLPRVVLHLFNWLIPAVTSMLPMIVTKDPFTSLYGPINTDQNSWCFIPAVHPIWIISTFDTFLVGSLLAVLFMFVRINCKQQTSNSSSSAVFHMYLGFKLYSMCSFLCFGPLLLFLCVVNVGSLTDTWSSDQISYYFNIVSIIMQAYGVLFPLCLVVMSTPVGTSLLNFICCGCCYSKVKSSDRYIDDTARSIQAGDSLSCIASKPTPNLMRTTPVASAEDCNTPIRRSPARENEYVYNNYANPDSALSERERECESHEFSAAQSSSSREMSASRITRNSPQLQLAIRDSDDQEECSDNVENEVDDSDTDAEAEEVKFQDATEQVTPRGVDVMSTAAADGSKKKLTYFEKQRLQEQEQRRKTNEDVARMSSQQREQYEQLQKDASNHNTAKTVHYSKLGSTYVPNSDLLSASGTRPKESRRN